MWGIASSSPDDAWQVSFRTEPPTPLAPLHPAIRSILDAEAPSPPFDAVPVAELRAIREALMLRRPRRNEPVARIEHRAIPRPEGEIAVRVFVPAGENERRPVLVYYHGGGWILGSLDTHEDVCRTLANRSNAVVVSVDYRRAPEHRFPGPLDDCCAAARWCAACAGDFGGDGTRLAVGGDSAGGNLAAAVAIRFRDEGGPPLKLQCLIYPVTNCGFDTLSYHRYAGGFGLTRDTMRFFWQSYLADPSVGADPYASPLQCQNLAGLPPALILTAQYDVLRDEGEAYAARLEQAGVPVQCIRYLGMNHGFLQLAATCEPALRGLEEIAGALRAAFTA